MNTKEKILYTALHLFARRGYEAVSVSDIAGEVGMTKGALYKHYESKRDIFDHIVRRMYETDEKQSEACRVPAETYGENAAAYTGISIGDFRRFTLAQFSFWTEDAFGADFRRMLTLEQYHSAEAADLYRNSLTGGPVGYTADIFREMLAAGVLSGEDARALAVEFYAPMYLFLCMSDDTEDKAALRHALEDHVDRFFKKHQNNTTKGEPT